MPTPWIFWIFAGPRYTDSINDLKVVEPASTERASTAHAGPEQAAPPEGLAESAVVEFGCPWEVLRFAIASTSTIREADGGIVLAERPVNHYEPTLVLISSGEYRLSSKYAHPSALLEAHLSPPVAG
jgi:hypothetical protein